MFTECTIRPHTEIRKPVFTAECTIRLNTKNIKPNGVETDPKSHSEMGLHCLFYFGGTNQSMKPLIICNRKPNQTIAMLCKVRKVSKNYNRRTTLKRSTETNTGGLTLDMLNKLKCHANF